MPKSAKRKAARSGVVMPARRSKERVKGRMGKLLLGMLVSGLGMWIVAGIWHNLIMANLYEGVHARHEGLGLLLVAYFVLAMMMSYMYPLGYQGGNPWLEGVRFGALIGLLWVLPHGLAMAGAHGTSVAYVFKNSLWHVVEQGIGGVIVALVYGRLARP